MSRWITRIGAWFAGPPRGSLTRATPSPAALESLERFDHRRAGHALTSLARRRLPASSNGPPDTFEESRSFLQRRLAFLGKAEALLGFGFYFAGNLVLLLLPSDHWKTVASTYSRLLVPASSTICLAAWLVCRRGRLPGTALLAIDATVAVVTAILGAFVVLAPRFPGEILGLPYSRMLLLIAF